MRRWRRRQRERGAIRYAIENATLVVMLLFFAAEVSGRWAPARKSIEHMPMPIEIVPVEPQWPVHEPVRERRV